MTVSVREQSRLHRSCGPLVQAHPGKSGIFALPDGLDAFAARVLLAGAAEHTLDVQQSGERSARGSGFMGSSSSSLHAKTFSVDRARVFVGSFNFDPRSARLNTELGFVIESPTLAQAIAEAFGKRIPERSYRVELTSARALQWTNDGKRYDREPGTGLVKRLAVAVLALLPIEWLL